MELTAFENRLGSGQGRIALAHAAPPSGDYVFVLGDDEAGRLFELAPGDRAEVVQQTDLSGVDLIRAHLRLRVPAQLPAGLAWEASIVVDGNKRAMATCSLGRERVLNDLAANVSKMTGLHQAGVRLELVEP
ncbi:MAG: hypothetical protein CSA24_02300 [Deltaproteobacteria bacterium]|nr:MAG: hypothetical protein CSA24_02300 [Deltaproteobacteria bacterium]